MSLQLSKSMVIDTRRIHEIDIMGLSEREQIEVKKRFFGPPAQSAMAEALKAALRKQSVVDLWAVYAGVAEPVKRIDAQPYRFRPELVRALTDLQPAPRGGQTVTAFSRWIHSLYGYRRGTAAAMEHGKHVEHSVAKLARPPSHPDWDLQYRDPLDGSREAKVISALTLNGNPLWGRPDLVFRNKRNGEIVIVERKASEAEIPTDGWPDLRAQLWCYGQIDEYRDAPAVRLIGEVWGVNREGNLYRRISGGGVMRWMRGEEPFESDNADLFARYKVKVEKC